MNDPISLWRRLQAENLVDAQPPEDDPSTAPTPWVARLLAGAAAWIATPLLLLFVALSMGDLLTDETAAIVIGALMCGAAIMPLRQPGGEFLQQGATIVSVAGIALVGFGLSQGLDLHSTTVAACLAVLSAALYALSRVPIHQFMCAGVLVFAMVWLFNGTSPERLSVLQPLVAWVAVLLWSLDSRADPAIRWHAHLPPLMWVVTITAVGLAWAGQIDAWDRVDPNLIVAARYASAALLPVAAFLVGRSSLRAGDRRLFLLLVIAAVVLAWLWRWSPGITLGIALMLVAFARGNALLLAFAAIALAVYLAGYYYEMAVPLLDKALWLGVAGAVLAILHVVLRRWPAGSSR